MNKLKKEFENDLILIDKELEKNDNPNFDLLIENIDFFLTVASDQKFHLKLPHNVKKLIKEYNDEEKVSDRFVNKYKKNMDFNTKLSNIANILTYYYDIDCDEGYYTCKVQNDEAKKIVADFFKSYDKDIYDFYENYIINGRVFYLRHILQNIGLSFEGDYLIEPYLFLTKEKNIFNITILAHEMIHIYMGNYYKNLTMDERRKLNNVNIREIYSHFIELLMFDYLESINFKQSDIDSCRKEFNGSLIEMLVLFNNVLDPNDYDFTDFDRVLLYNEAETYSYGKVFAYHFYDNYLKNKEETKNNIFRLSIEGKDHDLKYIINHYGLNENKILDHKVLAKYLEK